METIHGFNNFAFKDTPGRRRGFVKRLDQRARLESAIHCGSGEIKGQSPQSTLRRGWFFGSQEFKTRLLEIAEGLLSERSEAAANYTGQEIRDHGKRQAESIITQALESLKISEDDLSKMKKSSPE